MNILPKQIYEFGPFYLDPVEHRLQRGSEPVLLTPKALDILLLLVQNSGRILEKNEIIRQVWPDTFIEETTLTQNIFTLRRALGETHGKRQYIETVTKKGYRFIADVHVIEGEAVKRESRSKQGRVAASVNELAPERSINSLAVLPLANASDDPQVEYLADGISESIIKSLAQLPGVRVMARSTVLRYKGLEVNPQEVGRQLGVQAVLVGRVLKVGDLLSIRAELVDVANGWHLWGEQYNRPVSHVFEVEQEVAEKISDGLQSKLTGAPQEQPRQLHIGNAEAYHAYLNGRDHWGARTAEGYRKALEYFKQAIEIDPEYALAYSGLADTYSLQCIGFQGWARPSESMPRAKAAAIKAVELNDSLAEAHASLAYIKMFWDWDWVNSEKRFQRAIELNPGYAHARLWYSHYLIALGRAEEALAECSRVMGLEPFAPSSIQQMGWYYLYERRYDEALEQLHQALKLKPDFFPSHLITGMTYTQVGEHPKAIEHYRRAFELEGTQTALGFLGYALAVSGEQDEALKVLRKLRNPPKDSFASPYHIALIHVGLGEKDQAFRWLERAFNERNEWMCWLKVAPELDGLRSDPRLANLIQRVGIPDSVIRPRTNE